MKSSAIIVDRERHLVCFGAKVCRLARGPMALIVYLSAHPGFVRSRQQILDQICPDKLEMYDTSVDTHVRRARRSLKRDLGVSPIGTQSGVGYYWKETL